MTVQVGNCFAGELSSWVCGCGLLNPTVLLSLQHRLVGNLLAWMRLQSGHAEEPLSNFSPDCTFGQKAGEGGGIFRLHVGAVLPQHQRGKGAFFNVRVGAMLTRSPTVLELRTNVL